ncbi:CBS domain-containing protein [Thalassotalea sp. M1531]|uniref:CBS domain-containing protein n=1 Tax=Thalassotalea algicola TaxID=2716224 RepID=A0A7Y0LB62_9GAMM|nr:CBS domain-containing protein [Thalassotalea algicola]NMP31299.1 CBS domain-containing protein [Thalassotalea algicola]
MKVNDLMTTVVSTVHLDDRLALVREIFNEHKFHHILVVDSNNKLAGILSDRDLLKAISPHIGLAAETTRDIATLNKRAHQVACRNVISLPKNASLASAVKIFHQHKVTCIPIVNEQDKPVGIITTKDIIRYLYEKITPVTTKDDEFTNKASNTS